MTDEEFINTVIAMIDPSRDVEVRISPKDYQRFCRHNCQRYEPETRAEHLRQGTMGDLFVDGEHSVKLKVVRDMVPGTVQLSPMGGWGARAFVLYPAVPDPVEYATRFEREFDL